MARYYDHKIAKSPNDSSQTVKQECDIDNGARSSGKNEQDKYAINQCRHQSKTSINPIKYRHRRLYNACACRASDLRLKFRPATRMNKFLLSL